MIETHKASNLKGCKINVVHLKIEIIEIGQNANSSKDKRVTLGTEIFAKYGVVLIYVSTRVAGQNVFAECVCILTVTP